VVAVDGFDRLYETARALGEDTRFRIYRQLYRSSDPVAVTTLAQEFSLHPNAIRQHLSRLEQAGLVVSRAERGGGGAGRPRRLYEPSPEPIDFAHPPRSMHMLVTVLAEAVDALPSDHHSLVAFGRAWGRSWATRRKRENGGSPRSRRGRADLLARELREWGWRPDLVRSGSDYRLTTGRCLWRDLVPSSKGRCCALEEGLLTGLTEALVNGHARVVRSEGCRLEVDL
jgi:predicted ArsR family transcriptional regulator